jgi:DNA-binding transcriptional MerR regulator
MDYKRADVARHFNRDGETIRRWTLEFASYLSPDANSQGRNKSRYSDNDMALLSLIHDMYDRGASVDEIHLALKTGQKGDFDGFLQNTRVQLTQGDIKQLSEIAMERDRLAEELQAARETIASLRARADLLAERDAEIARLNRLIGRLEGQIELLKGNDK